MEKVAEQKYPFQEDIKIFRTIFCPPPPQFSIIYQKRNGASVATELVFLAMPADVISGMAFVLKRYVFMARHAAKGQKA